MHISTIQFGTFPRSLQTFGWSYSSRKSWTCRAATGSRPGGHYMGNFSLQKLLCMLIEVSLGLFPDPSRHLAGVTAPESHGLIKGKIMPLAVPKYSVKPGIFKTFMSPTNMCEILHVHGVAIPPRSGSPCTLIKSAI